MSTGAVIDEAGHSLSSTSSADARAPEQDGERHGHPKNILDFSVRIFPKYRSGEDETDSHFMFASNERLKV